MNHNGELFRRPPEKDPVPRRGIHGALCHEDALLMVRAPKANWLELPGGGIEPGETPLQALRRELREEAGVDLRESLLEAAQEACFRSHYYATGHREFWRYEQAFRLIHLPERPSLGEPLEAGHERFWVPIAHLHRERIHYLHRIGIDQLLLTFS